MPTLGRIAAATAAALALTLAPIGMASAQSTVSAPRDHREDVSITLTDGQRAGVLAARSAYITTASGVRMTYRATVEGILDEARKTTGQAQLAYDIAKDAYAFTRVTGGDATAARTSLDTAAAAYKAALESARAVARPKLDAAKTTARTALDKAVSDYVTAIRNVVTNPPPALLVPPGRGKSWISHGFGKDYGMGWDSMGRR